jgi:O-antigen/teichoic acid export membrane protein
MRPDAFGVWCLVLQVSAYVGYLDFGIQTAVGRFVAQATEKGEANHRDRIVSTALAALGALAILGSAGTLLVAIQLPHIFRQMPSAFVGEARLALVLVASSLAVGLPASVFNGVFVGLQRHEVPAAIVGGSRIFSATLLVLVVRRGGGLIQMGAAVAAVNLCSYLLQYLMYRKLIPESRASVELVSYKTGRELFDYCLSLSVWSFAMLLVTGLDVILVGYFQFEAVAYYTVAAGLVTFLAGLQNAVFSALMPAAAVLHARGDSQSLGRILIKSSRYGTFLLVVTGLPLMLFAMPILRYWVGQNYAGHGSKYLIVLVLANVIRLFATPYAVTLIGTGQQRLVILSPLMEGITNLVTSAALGYALGAIGIAYGTLCGAIVGVLLHMFYSMPRTTEIRFAMREYLRDALLRPVAFTVPLLSYAAAQEVMKLGAGAEVTMALASIALSAVVLWTYGLFSDERARVLGLLRIAPARS